MKKTHVFEAADGTRFSTLSECKTYEEKVSFGLLIGLAMDDIDEALSRINIPLSDALERAGNIIADKRRKSGELKRKTPGMKAEASVNATMSDIKKSMKAIS